MPYGSDIDLPPPVRKRLPSQAQTLCRQPLSRTRKPCKADSRHEEIAHCVAWAAVQKSYRKRGHVWLPKQEAAALRH